MSPFMSQIVSVQLLPNTYGTPAYLLSYKSNGDANQNQIISGLWSRRL